jgi:plasmid stabilization system protein ParE
MSEQKLTFRQREGIDPLPSPLDKENLSPELRNAIWNYVFKKISTSAVRGYRSTITLGNDWYDIYYSYHCNLLNKAGDEFSNDLSRCGSQIKDLILYNEWSNVINFLEHVAQHRSCPHLFDESINFMLEKFLYPYRIIHKMFTPSASEEEAEAIQNAFDKLNENRLGGAQTHLTSSIEFLKQEKYRDSIRESIHAVESVSSVISGQKKALLRDALKTLKNSGVIEDGELKKSFEKLYDYTNEAKGGIRHALLKDESNIDIEEAQFMLGACASFVSYLISKANKADISIIKDPETSSG